jgi:LPS export ABC transporter protein LptC
MPWRAVFISVLIAVALAGYSLLTRNDNELTDTPAPAQPGYYLKQASIIETDASGAARLKLQAAQIVQNLADDSISMQQVSVISRSEDGTDWLLTANQGQLPANSKTVSFSGDVYVRPQNAQLQRPQIRTEALSINTEQNLATAPGRVSFELDQQHLTAVGLKYDLKRQKLKLNSQVHGQFQAK